MTICIAACAVDKATGKNFIVTVSDTKLTTGMYSQDVAAMKLKRVHKHWAAMIAGKFGQHNPIVMAITRELKAESHPSLGTVADACSRVYVEEAKRMAEEAILAKYGLTMDAFIKSRHDIGDSLFEKTWGEISRIQVGCDLLICGFDQAGPHILCVSNPTSENPSFVTYYDSPGFAAIGTGYYLAESTLYAFKQSVVTSLDQTIYHATTAKFIAESASDVGEQTFMLIFGEDGERFPLSMETYLENELRRRWIAKGQPTIPDDALQMINEAIKEATPSASQT